MSGSTIGGVVGGVIGFVVSGFNPAGAQWGFMIGSAAGALLFPDTVTGPKLTDPQRQTSNDGVPRPIVYGTAAVMGNVIQCQSVPTEHKHTEGGKGGGPVQETFTYTRTCAIRICEAAPLGGEMLLRRVWVNGKLGYDASGSGAIDVESAKFLAGMTFYSGSESQLPNADLEALPAEDGGGVGNVPAYRGTCYAVLRDVDVTQGQGALPVFRWEVSSCGSQSVAAGSEILVTGPSTAPGSAGSVVAKYGTDPANLTAVSTSYLNASNAPYCVPAYGDGTWVVTRKEDSHYTTSLSGAWTAGTTPNVGSSFPVDSDFGGGVFMVSGNADFANSQFFKSANAGATFTSMTPSHALTNIPCVKHCGGQSWIAGLTSRPKPMLTDDGGASWVDASSSGFTGFQCARDADYWNGLLVMVGGESPPDSNAGRIVVSTDKGDTSTSISTTTQRAESVAHGPGRSWCVACHNGDVIATDDDFATTTTHAGVLPALGNTGNSYTHMIYNGLYYITYQGSTLYYSTDRVAWSSSNPSLGAITGIATSFAGYAGIQMPDAPDYYVDPDTGIVTGPTGGSVTACKPGLDEIVADFCERVGVTDYDVSALSADEVIGYAITQPTDAAGAIRMLQQVYYFDMPEWGNSGDTGTKLRAVKRGGASVLNLSDDALVDVEDDEDTRAQAVEFPRKLNLMAPDPDLSYEVVKQTSERVSENVKAVGEVNVSTSVIFTPDQRAQVADIALRVLWEEAAGKAVVTVPEEYTQYVTSDIITRNDKRYRIDRIGQGDGTSRWELTRDRASAYSSNATAGTTLAPPAPTGSARGPTLFQALNLPSLRSSDTTPGVYVAVCGVLPGWNGCDLYLSVDGGVTEQRVATLIDPAIMGTLSADMATGDVTMAVSLYNDDELDTVTPEQIDARLNAVAVTSAGVSEIIQFQTATDTGTKAYDLTDLTRPGLNTTEAAHSAGDGFVVLDQSVAFIPITVPGGTELIFRPVSRGTTPASNATYSVVFSPPTFIRDGGVVTP